MKKYTEIAVTHLKTQLVWRADVIFNMLFTIARILFAYLLWGIIFTEKSEVSGFTFHGMLSYYIFSSFLTQLDMSKGISNEITDRIRNGTFSKYLVMPVNVEGYFIAQEVGTVLFYLVFDLAAALIWILVFRIEFMFTGNIFIITCAVLMILLGLLFMVQLNFWLGILTLKYEEISTFLMIKDNLIALVTGSIVPLTLFPEQVTEWMRILPFYYVTYLPAMLLTGRCSNEAIVGVAVIAGWCAVIQVILMLTWRKYRRKYDAVGV